MRLRVACTQAQVAAQIGMKEALHVDERVDHLVGRNAAGDSGKGHVRRRESVGDAHGVALDAWDFHRPGHRIADEPEKILEGDGRRVALPLEY